MDNASYRHFLYVALPIVGLLGLASGATALVALAAAGYALLVSSFWAGRQATRGLGVGRELYPSGFEDDSVDVRCTLENRSERAAVLVFIHDVFGPGVVDRQILLEAGPLAPGRRRHLSYHGLCSRPWGEYLVGPLTLAVSDPFGFFESLRVFSDFAPFTVFPRVLPVAGLERLGSRPSLTPQEMTRGRAGQSLSYLGVRDYRPGDDARRIHWPATARRGQLAVKEYEVDLVPHFTLLLDLHKGGRAGTGKRSTLEYVVRTAASVVWAAALRGELVQIIGEGKAPLLVPPGRGELHATQCLFELVRLRQDGDTDLFEVVERHHAQIPEGSTAALLCARLAFDDLRLQEALATLRARSVRPIVLVVNDSAFIPVDRRPLSKEQVRERCAEVAALLAESGVAGGILGAEETLAGDLARPDLFGEVA